jgi:hypothetical protein
MNTENKTRHVYKQTNSREMNPTREAASRSDTQEFLSILWDPKAHYLSFSVVPILSQMNPGHTTRACRAAVYGMNCLRSLGR